MTYILQYLDEVDLDVREAKIWYKKKLDGLEKRFAQEIKRTIGHIELYPLHFEIKYRNVRIAYTHIFPYAIHYYINHNQITIIAIVATHQNPDTPKNRI